MEKGGIFLIKVSYSDLGSMFFSTVKPIQLEEVYGYISKNENIQEAVVLWTCNRFEIYFYPGSYDSVQFFDEFLKGKVYKYSVIHGEDAVRHLFLVSAGLDSMVLGENEILGQVKEAWMISQKKGYSGTNMNQVFRKAIEVGKKVRTLHGFNKIKRSVASEAIEFIDSKEEILIIGAGKLGTQIAKMLKEKGLNFSISNRTEIKGKNLAKELNVDFVDFDVKKWANFHTIIIAASSNGYLIKKEDIVKGKVQKIIDLSFPPSVDPELSNKVELVNMERLSSISEINNKRREALAREALKTVEEEYLKFITNLNEREKQKIIKKFVTYTDNILNEELEIFSKEIPREYMLEVEMGIKATRNKILGPLIQALKNTADIKSSSLLSELERVLDEQLSKSKVEKVKEVKGN